MTRSNIANGHNYFDLEMQTVSAGADVYVVRAVIYLTSYNVIDANNNLNVAGNWSRSGTLALNGVYNAVPVWYQDISVNRVVGVNIGLNISVSWSGVEYWGVTLSASNSYTVPAKPTPPPPITAPSAPTGYSARDITQTSAYTTGISVASNGGAALNNLWAQWYLPGGQFIGERQMGAFTDVLMSPLVGNTTYHFRCAVANGSYWSAWGGFVAFTTAPVVPVMGTAHTATSITRNSAIISGLSVISNGGATLDNARVELNTSASTTGMTTVLRGSWGDVTLTGLAALTTYYYRPGAHNIAGWSAAVAWKSFTTLDDAPNDMAAPTFSSVTDTSMRVSWVAPAMNGATFIGYKLEVSLVSNFATLVQSGTTLALFSDLVGLLPGKVYFVRVKALATPYDGGYGTAAQLTTGYDTTLGDRVYSVIGGVVKKGDLYGIINGVVKLLRLNVHLAGEDPPPPPPPPPPPDGTKLTWAPPTLTNPTTIVVTNTSDRTLTLSTTQDYIIDMPNPITVAGGLTIEGGRNIVWIGGEIRIPSNALQDDPQSRALYLKGQTGTVHIEGVLLAGNMSEGIDLDQRLGAIIRFQNVRCELVSGSYAGAHADVIQTWAGPKRLQIDHFTGYTGYQGFFLIPLQFGSQPAPENFDFHNVDLDGGPGSGYMIWKASGSTWPFYIDNVWVEPNGKTDPNSYLWPYGAFPTVRNGIPPGGNFVPVGRAGVNYVSPGYIGVTGPNAAPVARFTSSVTNLTASVNASTSSDSDGNIVNYAWNWGDGSAAGSGVTASHTYAAAGTYSVGLTVTDDDAAIGTVSNNVVATDPVPGTYIISDDFARTSTTSPGVADTGQTWTASSGVWGTDGNGLYNVGYIDGGQVWIPLGSVTQEMSYVLPVTPTSCYPTALLRYASTATQYRIEIAAGNALAIKRRVSNSQTTLVTSATGVYTAGQVITASAVEEGAGTRVIVKVAGTQVLSTLDTAVSRPQGTSVGFRHGSGSNGTAYEFQQVRVI